MLSFQHVTPALRLFHGTDSMEMLSRELDRIGSRRAVIVCGRTLGREGSPLALVRSAMGARCAAVYAGVRAHSPLPSVREAARMLAWEEADAVVAVGGGSAIVTARAAAILLAEGIDAHDLCTQRGADGKIRSPKLLAPKLPQLVIPTTPTTACVKAGSAVFDPVTKQRLAMFDPKTRAQSIFIHPQLILTAPPALVLSASLNALAMAVEGLESETGDPLSDALLMHSLRLFGKHLPKLAGAGEEAALRGELMLAALLCGQGTDYAGGGIASVLGHAIGARFQLENGLANAVLLPHTMRFNSAVTAGRIYKVTTALSQVTAAGEGQAAIAAVEYLLAGLQIPRRLRDGGVPGEALTSIADAAMGDWFVQKNPRPVADARALLEVLESAW